MSEQPKPGQVWRDRESGAEVTVRQIVGESATYVGEAVVGSCPLVDWNLHFEREVRAMSDNTERDKLRRVIDRARRSDDYSLIGTDRIVDAILAEYEIRPRRDATARFWSKVDKSGECWVWTKYLNPDGYAYFWFDGRRVRAHKWAYEQEHGPVADGLVLDHLCRNRACVNPAHLEPVTTWENLRRGESFSAENVAKTHCDNGHEFTPENTYVDGNGWRACRECHRFNNRAKGQRPAICPVCGETRSAWGMSNHVKSQHGMTLTEAKVARQS